MRQLGADSGTALVAWYRTNRRSLPWRDATGPYPVLVSEIMLQQTRVETVIPFYQRFLAAFPDIESLARSPVDEVLACWSGLGYYSRARRLHDAARAIVERGGFPRTARELLELPGVGAYTAAAIASIAFGEPVAVVDGNVERVLARLLDLEADPKRGAARREVGAAAAALLDATSPGDSNQAVMELGATVCLPRRPRCPSCPLASSCLARERGTMAARPVRPARRAAVREQRVVAVVRRGERFLLLRNPGTDGLLAGLWEFPWTRRVGRRSDREVALGETYGGRWRLLTRRGVVRHTITYRALELAVHDAEVRYEDDAIAETASGAEPGWLSREEIAEQPTTSMVRKVLEIVAPEPVPARKTPSLRAE